MMNPIVFQVFLPKKRFDGFLWFLTMKSITLLYRIISVHPASYFYFITYISTLYYVL